MSKLHSLTLEGEIWSLLIFLMSYWHVAEDLHVRLVHDADIECCLELGLIKTWKCHPGMPGLKHGHQ